MYAVYRQAHPPTGVEFSMYCNFFSNTERNLVVAGTSQLYVYRLNHDSEVSCPLAKPSKGKGHKEKLELVASFSFFGNVMSMASVQLAGAKRDALLLSFKDAKLSVVEYDAGTHDLKTLSLHYFEEPELKDGFVQNVHIPKVRVDPDGRCAVMLIYGTRLVVLPFRRETLTDEHEGVMGEGQKSSFLPSYIIDVRELDEKLLNIIDMQFLYGYYEPTLLILFEPNQTWPGRVAVRQDTCSIVTISLNIMQKVHPVIWSLSNLPFDCTQALAVPKPIGGVVIFAVNSLLYLNQSVPPYGVSLNSLTTGTTVFPLRKPDGVKVTLDCAQAAFISYDKMVISLKGGEIYVLTLITDGMRSVRSFHFDKAAASVLTTCMITMEPGYLFLGSRLGNSLLLKYTEKLQEPPVNVVKDPADKQDEPPVKKKRSESSGNWDEVDEIEVYGSEAQSGTQLATYSFEVCDSILNIGPCANAAMGEPAFLSEEFQNNPEPDLEIVVCSGYGKNGALSVLQKSIRPQVVTTFLLPGCYDMWTVISPQKKEESAEKEPGLPEPEDDGKRHGFLILSREDSTMVRALLHFIPVDLGSPIVHCAVADPYVVIMSAEGQVTMFVLKSDTYGGRTHRLTLQKPQLHHQSKVIALCVYRDVRGMFTTESRTTSSRDELSMRSHSEVETVIQDISNTVDDEEEMLYGDSSSLFSPSKEEPRRSSLPLADRDPHQYKVEPTHWCVLVRENGAMERVLVDSSFGQPAAQGDAKKEEVTRQGEMPLVKEVLLVALGNRQSRPYLLVSAHAAPGAVPLPGQASLRCMGEGPALRRAGRWREAGAAPLPEGNGLGQDCLGGGAWVRRASSHPGPGRSCSPDLCLPLPLPRIELEEWEHVTCMKTVSLKSEETVSGLKGYIAAGTCLMQGEEVTCRGRILIMDIIEVVPEPGQPLTKNKFKVLYEKEQKGPVTALCHCHGYLVSAIGQKIFLWSLKDNDLTGMAFIDTQLYIHQMISVKNFILAADVMKSISLLRYQEESKTLSLVSRDAKPLEVYSVDFMVDTDQLGFLGIWSLHGPHRALMALLPLLLLAKESFGGMRLLRRADFHVGAHVNTFWRTPCRWATDGVTKKSSAWESKHITWFATLDGGIGLLLPMLEKTYRRLLMLQNALTTMLSHHAGLNPRAFRMLHVDRRILQNAVRNILDGELLTRYLYLSAMERNELAKKIGTTPDMVSRAPAMGSRAPSLRRQAGPIPEGLATRSPVRNPRGKAPPLTCPLLSLQILEDLLEIDRVTAHF
uniref:Cleavage and polyadenylation specificity factor subunit 1 n=1 Tax=Chelydra serpentina TaxID=8475 RepID=A0A8C3S0H6_CHESE